ncbi:hypothetical protein ASZ90_010829 [hydrocarbon metagenome]|uniref:Uncharacterized protein n=1 Tax=hydrocarbon metagenome TaxID=938273 RepID=A0A0W8FFN7_9ZZZZ
MQFLYQGFTHDRFPLSPKQLSFRITAGNAFADSIHIVIEGFNLLH